MPPFSEPLIQKGHGAVWQPPAQGPPPATGNLPACSFIFQRQALTARYTAFFPAKSPSHLFEHNITLHFFPCIHSTKPAVRCALTIIIPPGHHTSSSSVRGLSTADPKTQGQAPYLALVEELSNLRYVDRSSEWRGLKLTAYLTEASAQDVTLPNPLFTFIPSQHHLHLKRVASPPIIRCPNAGFCQIRTLAISQDTDTLTTNCINYQNEFASSLVEIAGSFHLPPATLYVLREAKTWMMQLNDEWFWV
ncbi:hypothetical protein F52700_5239 [Fusarium sp. NRRL 52700]|nr:hypothetical protein F52700_5239 [Fusarium sp. NRRL 52700]